MVAFASVDGANLRSDPAHDEVLEDSRHFRWNCDLFFFFFFSPFLSLKTGEKRVLRDLNLSRCLLLCDCWIWICSHCNFDLGNEGVGLVMHFFCSGKMQLGCLSAENAPVLIDWEAGWRRIEEKENRETKIKTVVWVVFNSLFYIFKIVYNYFHELDELKCLYYMNYLNIHKLMRLNKNI